jgi:hypothetical protein
LRDFMSLPPRPKSFLDAARRDWQFEVFAWLLRNTGGFAKFRDTALVLPTEEFFPDRGMKGHAGVAALFRRVREHAGMADWPCTVEPASEAAPATPEPGSIPVFRYQREGIEPIALVAQFARELARYLVAAFDEPAPGGEARHEPALEITSVFLGFGMFAANTAARTRDFQLSEGEVAHALALFCLLRGLPPDAADEHLNPHLRKHVRLASLDLQQHEMRFHKLRGLAAVPAGIAERAPPARAG